MVMLQLFDILVARRLSVDGYSEWAYFFSILSLLFFVGWFGVGSSARISASTAASAEEKKEYVKASLVLQLAVTAVVALLLFLGPGNAALLSSPLWVCGGLCLICRRHPALWCAWAGYAIVYGYLRVCTGIRFWWALCAWLYRPGLEIHAVLALAELLGLLALAAVTVRTFRRGRKQ